MYSISISRLPCDQKEAMFLGELQLRHPCLVRMIGYCCEEEHRLLVYELMDHGSLDDYFFKRTYAHKEPS